MTQTDLKRQPLLRAKPTGKFKMQPFQEEDLAFLADLDASSNWSEMLSGR